MKRKNGNLINFAKIITWKPVLIITYKPVSLNKIHLKYVPKTKHFYEQIPKPDIYEQKLQFEMEKKSKSMGFYLNRLERKQIDGILSLQIQKKTDSKTK